MIEVFSSVASRIYPSRSTIGLLRLMLFWLSSIQIPRIAHGLSLSTGQRSPLESRLSGFSARTSQTACRQICANSECFPYPGIAMRFAIYSKKFASVGGVRAPRFDGCRHCGERLKMSISVKL
jgi:hypothetical protein